MQAFYYSDFDTVFTLLFIFKLIKDTYNFI